MPWLIALAGARALLPEGEECPGSSPFASLGYFSRREKNVWLIRLRFARVLLPEGEECRGSLDWVSSRR